jgi:hypothetical protein
MTPPVLLFILRLREAFTKIDRVLPSFDEAFFSVHLLVGGFLLLTVIL